MSILYVRDGNGDLIPVPAIKGEKGDPYTLTETDKTTIVNAVISALPKYTGGVS